MVCKECNTVMKRTKYYGKKSWYCSKCKSGHLSEVNKYGNNNN